MTYKTQFANALLLAAIAALIFGCSRQSPQPPLQPKAADKSSLIGIWDRTDAPYRIRITELLDDGTMKTGYFNPKSINVGKANWVNTGGVIKLYIELTDEHYPGSKYSLTYLPESDSLAGNYFQAVEGTNFQVAFARSK